MVRDVRASGWSGVYLARCLASGRVCNLSSEATSRLDHLATRIWDGRKQGKHFGAVYCYIVLAVMWPSNFTIEIWDVDG